MLNHKSELHLQEIDDSPKNITVQLIDSPRSEVVVVLPAAAEFGQLEKNYLPELSVSATTDANSLGLTELYKAEASKLRSKYDRFHSSYTYLNHLARLHHMAGDVEEASVLLKAALESDPQSFLRIDLGSMFIDQNDNEKARLILSQCNLEEDLGANLKLAHAMARANQLENAWGYVDKALSIDCSDYAAQMFAGAINLSNRNLEQAVRCFRAAAETKNDSSPLSANLAAAYWGLGEREKTVKALRQAISLDPMNENAVLFLSDVMLLLGTPEKCIVPLQVILSYKQDNEALWASAARAFYELGTRESKDKSMLKKALDALTIQSRLRDSSSIVNNIGVVYNALGETHKACRYFGQSCVKARYLQEDDNIPFSNYVSSLIQLKEYDEAFRLSKEHLQSRGDNVLPRVYVHYVVSMEGRDKRGEAALEAERILESGLADDETSVELLAHLCYYKTLIKPDSETIMRFLPKIEEILSQCHDLPQKLRCQALNNLVFGLLHFGQISQAKQFLGQLGRWVHSEPFATATLGLYHLKRGKIERAEALYKESISLSTDSTSKERIRQRMFIEFGRFYLERGDHKLSEKYLNRALKQKGGFEYAKNEGRKLLLSIRKNVKK